VPPIEVSQKTYDALMKWKERYEKELKEQSGHEEEVSLDFLIQEALIAAQEHYEALEFGPQTE